MGILQQEESPSTRSSSMSFALRWMHEKRLIILVALVSLAMTFMLLVLLNENAKKSISLVVDGQHIQVETKNSLLQHLLDEQAIEIGQYDKLSMPLNSTLKNGDSVEIWRAKPVLVTVDGNTTKVYSTDKTVGEVIKAEQISLSSLDRVKPSLDTQISDDLKIIVTRIEKKTENRKVTVPFGFEKKPDAKMLIGNHKVVNAGKAGEVVQTIQNWYADGKLVTSEMVSKTYTAQAQNKVIAYGTKKPEPKVTVLSAAGSGTHETMGFNYSKKLTNVSLVSYSGEAAGIGTRTASGTRTVEGVTIAVDPKVIPLGWWVYIEGLGYRRAEDTGTAIKGHIIDVFVDKRVDSRKFGRKDGRTVYVIGPVKPSAS